jgi:phosphate-selective porin OprO/OprP
VDSIRRWSLVLFSLVASLAFAQVPPPGALVAPQTQQGSQGLVLTPAAFPLQLRLRGLVQADGRDYPGDEPSIPSAFLVRRARVYIEGAYSDLADFRILPEFGQGTFQLLDAYVDFHPVPLSFLKLRVGKYKTPFGLERLVQEQNLRFIERGLVSQLVPDRDVGAALHGDAYRGFFVYEAGVFNGTTDNGNVDTDLDGEKDVVLRGVFQPFRPLKKSWLDDVGLGFATTVGNARGTATSTLLPSFRTTGMQTFFSYLTSTTAPATGTVVAHGAHTRIEPQAYAFVGPVGALYEYVRDSTSVSKGTVHGRVIDTAWQVQGFVVLTGEHGNLEGLAPKNPWDLKAKHFGAVELIGRYGELSVGKGAFPVFADPTKSARGAQAWAAGVNWYLAQQVKLAINFERTVFQGGAKGDAFRPPENDLIGRVQFAL